MKNKTTIGKNYLDKFLSNSDDELYHYGTKGQKWGVRNYQNKDGTLTEAGKARYNDSGTYKDPEKMSTDDLIRSSNRLNAEYNYKRLQDVSTPEKRSQQKRSAIKKAALSSLISTGATFAATYGISALYNKVKGKKVRAGEMAANAAIASLVVGAGTLPNLFNAVNIPNVQVQSQIDKSKNDKKDKDSVKHSDKFSDELYHYGIKGQKWGIRRYQNPDGSFTDEGLIRYGVDRQGNMSSQGRSLYKKDKQHDKARKIATGAAIGIGAAAAVVAGAHAVNLILDKKYGKSRAANIVGPKGDHSSFRIGKNLSGTKISSHGVMTGHKWFTDYSFKFKNKLNKKTGKIVNTHEFKRGINWAKAIGLASSLGFIGGAVAKRLTKNKQKENDYVVNQQMNEVSNQKALDYYKKTGKLPVSTEKKRR